MEFHGLHVKPVDIVFLVSLPVTVFLVFLFAQQLGSLAQSFEDLFLVSAVSWGYLGAAVLALGGNFTILVPFPYILGIFSLGAVPGLNPLIIGVIAGVSATVGELSSYVLGRGISKVQTSPEQKAQMEAIKALLNRRHGGFLTVFLFAATPLPDDLLYVPLGIIGYPFRRAAFGCFLGKTLFMTMLAVAGFYYQLGLMIFFPVEDTISPFSLSLDLVLLLVACYIVIRINWFSVLKFLSRTK